MRRVFRLPPGGASIAHELDDELAFHLETRIQRLVATGMSPEAAREEALRQFGDIEAVRHDCLILDHDRERAMRRSNMFDEMRQDLAYAFRALRHNRGFALTVILTLALGLGVNMAMFSFLDVVFLRPPAGVHDPDGVRRVWTELQFRDAKGGTTPQYWSGFSYPQYAAVRSSLGADVAAATYRPPSEMWVGRGEQAATARVSHATASYFELLGARPLRGRFFGSDEDRVGAAAPVVVASHAYWRNRLGADPDVVGQEIHIAGQPYTLIGVAAEGFTGVELNATDLWLPLGPGPGYAPRPWWTSHHVNGFQILLRPPSSSGDALVEKRVATGLRSPEALRVPADTANAVRLGSIIRARGPGVMQQEVKIAMRLAGVTFIVLIIAGANVVNLLLARAVRRRREIAVRLAMGISRLRLARLLLAESVLLAGIAGAAAVLAAYWGGELLRGLLMPEVKWAAGASTVHWRVLGLALAAGVGAGILAGLLPALQSMRLDLVGALKMGDGGSDHPGHSRLRSALVVAQAALSMVLLVGAGLFVSSLNNVRGVRTGYDAGRIVNAGVEFDTADSLRAARLPGMLRELAERLRAMPGVEAVALARMAPTQGFSMVTYHPDVDTLAYPKPFATFNLVSPEFFEATGTRVVRGEDFPRAAGAAMPPVVLVNEALARAQWPGMEALGRCMRFAADDECYRVIGVVETAMFRELLEDPAPQFYLPLDNPPETVGGWFRTVVVKTAGGGGAREVVSAEIRNAVRQAFPGGRPTITTMEQLLEPQYRPWRVGASLFTAFGVLALVVAALGIYSTIAYMVAQRTHEFGVRTALGAQTSDILRQVIGRSVRTVAIGVAVGIGLAIAGGRFVAALLYGIEPGDPAVMIGVAAALLAVAAGAAFWPAWRAARVDPATALRAE